jgi:hypothetical protein
MTTSRIISDQPSAGWDGRGSSTGEQDSHGMKTSTGRRSGARAGRVVMVRTL